MLIAEDLLYMPYVILPSSPSSHQSFVEEHEMGIEMEAVLHGEM